MNNILTILFVLCVSIAAKAHQPDLSSTILVENDENQWILQIRAALTAFEYEVEANFGKDSYSSPEEFQELVIKLVRDNMSIVFNGSNANTLQNGQVQLGHETSIKFEVLEVPESIESLVVRNSSFSDISRNQSALIVLKKGFSKNQFILTNSNQHTAELKAINSKFELIVPTQSKTQYYALLGAGLIFVLSALYFVYLIKRRVVLTPAFSNA